ncbi:MAG: DinB family protein [Acidobacteria bacterium]|jgi:uncharacterized damage-inducible protein DinB|nr:DinB family protein [Acidobacteriota bacterium]
MTPYASYVAGQDPLNVLRSTLDGYRAVFARSTAADWAAPWAEGKWTAHQVLVHVTQWEMFFSARVRMALAMPGYVVQAMEQDDVLNLEAPVVDTATASAAFEAVRRMNIALIASLSLADLARKITHPERGEIDVEDLIVTLAGHPAHHLTQLTR